MIIIDMERMKIIDITNTSSSLRRVNDKVEIIFDPPYPKSDNKCISISDSIMLRMTIKEYHQLRELFL